MDELSRKDLKTINAAKGLAKWLSIDISIKIFGIELIAYHWPPKTSES